jgi:tetratricopeptide (TPR) repeat protein
MKLKYIPVLIGLLSLSSACKKQLNTIPTDFLTPVNFYKTEEDLNKALVGVYDILSTDRENGGFYQNLYLHVLSYGNDEGIYTFPQTIWRTVSVYNLSATDTYVSGFWNVLYTGINRANTLLEALEKADVPAEKRDQIKGQALVLRAYYYFMLGEHWGDVPMRLTPTVSSVDVNLPKTPLAEVYAQVVKDLETAEALLPQAGTYGGNSSGRISKNTAQGMLARVNLTWAGSPLKNQSRYAEALKWSKKVITTGDNNLNPDYTDNFIREARDEYYDKELMWEVEFYGNVTDTHREQGFVGVRNGVRTDNGNVQNVIYPGFSYAFLRPTGTLFNLYEVYDPVSLATKDLRRERVIAPYDWLDAVNPIVKQLKTTAQIYDRWPGKWRRDEEKLLPRFKNGNGTNFPILRYADVLLMFAEAENEVNGPTADAYNAINEVRRRAYGTGNRVATITLTSGGSGYTTAPEVVIDNSQGSNGAIAYATVAGGQVTAITIMAPGGFYNAAPKVTLTGGGGSGATASATVSPINRLEADLIPGLNKQQFFDELKDERSRELAFECLRSPDLRRWGILVSTVQNVATEYRGATNILATTRNYGVEPGNNIQDHHVRWPIPSREIQLNSAITQNPGY